MCWCWCAAGACFGCRRATLAQFAAAVVTGYKRGRKLESGANRDVVDEGEDAQAARKDPLRGRPSDAALLRMQVSTRADKPVIGYLHAADLDLVQASHPVARKRLSPAQPLLSLQARRLMRLPSHAYLCRT